VSDLSASRSRVTPSGRRHVLEWTTALLLFAAFAGGCRSASPPSFDVPVPDSSRPRPVGVAVFPLSNRTGDPALGWLGPAALDALTWHLRRTTRARVVDIEEIVQVTGRTLADLAMLGPADQVAAGRALGVDYVVIGTYTGGADALRSEITVASAADPPPRAGRSFTMPESLITATSRPSASTGRAIIRLADAALGGGRAALQDAVAHLEAAIRSDPDRPELHLRLGQTLVQLRAYDRALRALAESRTRARRQGDPAVEIRSLDEMGRASLDMGRAGDAERHYRDALTIATDDDDWPGAVAAVRGIGIAQYFRGEYALAAASFDAALGIARWLGDRRAEAAVLVNLADVTMAPGDYAEARTQLQRALALARMLRDPVTEAWAMNDLGFVALRLGSYREAEDAFAATLALARARDDRRAEGLALKNLGRVALAKGAYAIAERHLADALVALRSIGAAILEIDAIEALATVRFRRHEHAAARAAYEEGLRLSRSLRLTLFESTFLFSLGQVALARDALGDARRFHVESLEVARRMRARRAEATALYGLAEVERRAGEPATAGRLFREAQALAERMGVREIDWRARYGLGTVFEAAGRKAEAVAEYRRAVDIVASLAQQFGDADERQAFLGDKFAPYDALVRLLLELHEHDPATGHATEAWAVLEAKKGRLVAEALSGATATLADARVRGTVRQIEETRARVQAIERAVTRALAAADGAPSATTEKLTRTLATAKDGYLQAVDAFLGRYPEYKALFVDQQTVDLRDLASFSEDIPPGTLAVQYYAAPDTLYIFIVTPGAHRVKTHAVSRDELYDLVRGYREYVVRPGGRPLGWEDDGSDDHRAHVEPLRRITAALSRHLLEPIADELQQYRDVVVMPNDLLFALPIHALTLDRENGPPRFMADTHRVSYLTRRHLAEIDRPSLSSADRSLLALGNPDGTLPAASQEVRALQVVRGTRARVLVGAEATKIAFMELAPQFGDLHLATHGVLDSERPGESHLVMAGEGAEALRLDVREISGLRLRNALAILSACETAVGELTPGAALITLAGAFSQAGARSIVASLWPVADVATRDFMVAFHRALLRDGRADALHTAQRTLIRRPETAHPFYWASFILLGRR